MSGTGTRFGRSVDAAAGSWTTWGALALLLAVGCDCGGTTERARPSVRVTPTSAFFGAVGVGQTVQVTLRVAAQTTGIVEVASARFEDLDRAGASAAFEILGVPLSVPGLREDTLTVRFTPTEVLGYESLLVLETNDPERPRVEVTLVGSGAAPSLAMTPVCDALQQCVGSITLDPPAIDFGAEPFQRSQPVPFVQLPGVSLVNDGEVDVVVRALDLEGADAEAFSLAADVFTGTGPDGEPALVLGTGAGEIVVLRFTPTSDTQESYEATLVIRSDALETPELRVALTGRLQPNRPPLVCANLTRVEYGEGSLPRNYGAEEDWAPLRPAPAGDLSDLTETRDVQPAAVSELLAVLPTVVTLSAHSPGDAAAACTTDPEDGRDGLTYRWTVLSRPPDASGETLFSPQAAETRMALGPQAGRYEVELLVTDTEGLNARRVLRFDAVLKQDLVVQLTWSGNDAAYRNVDLDLHLVRPSTAAAAGGGSFAGAFDFFNAMPGGERVSGDINGRSVQALQSASGGGAIGFDWGLSGTADDPRLSRDDLGGGPLLETISLNDPQNDSACERTSCRYPIYVHYFRDERPLGSPPACAVTGVAGCVDGARCNCPAEGQRCVADVIASEGPLTGPGKCYLAPEPVVRVFLEAEATPAAVIPLPEEALRVGAPCELIHVADVVWPARLRPDGTVPEEGETGEPTVELVGTSTAQGPVLPTQHFGRRATGGSRVCEGNVERTLGGAPFRWYEPDP